jgi:hypothetical protein
MKTIVLALCFMAVFEGIMPLVAPDKWKRAVRSACDLPDRTLAGIGAFLVAAGLAAVWLVMLFWN